VTDARAVAAWYVNPLGFSVAQRRKESPFTHFLDDDTGRVIVEFYFNPAAPVPDYAAAHPLCFHLVVVAADAREECCAILGACRSSSANALNRLRRAPFEPAGKFTFFQNPPRARSMAASLPFYAIATAASSRMDIPPAGASPPPHGFRPGP